MNTAQTKDHNKLIISTSTLGSHEQFKHTDAYSSHAYLTIRLTDTHNQATNITIASHTPHLIQKKDRDANYKLSLLLLLVLIDGSAHILLLVHIAGLSNDTIRLFSWFLAGCFLFLLPFTLTCTHC
jgi:hypothetical protein